MNGNVIRTVYDPEPDLEEPDRHGTDVHVFLQR